MDKLVDAVRDAAHNLRTVALGLRIPLDVSQLDKALDDLLTAAKPAPVRKPE